MAFVNAPCFGRPSVLNSRAASPRRSRVTPRAAAAAQPLSDRVIVRVDDAANQTAGGLFLGRAETDNEQRCGTVLAVGPGRYSPEGQREVIDLAPGDHVLWKDNYGAEKIQADASDGEVLALKVFSIVAKW